MNQHIIELNQLKTKWDDVLFENMQQRLIVELSKCDDQLLMMRNIETEKKDNVIDSSEFDDFLKRYNSTKECNDVDEKFRIYREFQMKRIV